MSYDLNNLDTDDFEFQQDVAQGKYGVPGLRDGQGWDPVPTEEYDPTPLDEGYNEGDETKNLFWSFWGEKDERPIDPAVYKGTHLDFYTLEEYRALNPRKAS